MRYAPLLLLLFLSIIIVSFGNCEICSCKKIPCAAFDNAEFNAWFPYNANAFYIFKDNSGRADTLNIFSVERSGPYEASKGCYKSDQGCNASANIYASLKQANNNNSNVNISFWQQTIFESSNQQKKLTVNFHNFRLQAADIGSNGLTTIMPPNYSADFFSQLTINNIPFTDVQLIMKDTVIAKETGIYKLYIARNQGIIGYELYRSKITWLKQ